jgi:cold shock protein
MHSGTIKYWDTRGFGFISRPDGEDIFVHVTRLPSGTDFLLVGQRLRFDIAISKRSGRPEATAVQLVDE